MEPIHRPNERFFIEYGDLKRTTIIRDSFDKFLTYIHEMRQQQKPYGFRLIFKPYYKNLTNINVPYGAEEVEVNNLLREWWTKITNRSFYYLLIDNLIFFEEDKRIKGKIYYWNREVDLHLKIQKYFFESSKKIEDSNLFDSYTSNKAKKCFYDLKKYIEMAVNASDEDVTKSKFEMMSTEENYIFQKLLVDTKNVIRVMEDAIKTIEKRRENWRFLVGSKKPLELLKEAYDLLKDRFIYQKPYGRED